MIDAVNATAPYSVATWADVLGLSWRETAALEWRRPELACTPGARTRLQRWARAGRPDGDARAITFRGDESTRRVVVDVLAKLPPPMRWHVVPPSGVAILAVGRTAAGWFSVLDIPPSDEPMHVVALDDGQPADSLPSLIAHELCHSWLSDVRPRRPQEPSGDELEESRERRAHAAALAREWGMVDRLTRPAELDEHRTCALVRALGFVGPGSDADRCARGMRDTIVGAAGPAVMDQEPACGA